VCRLLPPGGCAWELPLGRWRCATLLASVAGLPRRDGETASATARRRFNQTTVAKILAGINTSMGDRIMKRWFAVAMLLLLARPRVPAADDKPKTQHAYREGDRRRLATSVRTARQRSAGTVPARKRKASRTSARLGGELILSSGGHTPGSSFTTAFHYFELEFEYRTEDAPQGVLTIWTPATRPTPPPTPRPLA